MGAKAAWCKASVVFGVAIASIVAGCGWFGPPSRLFVATGRVTDPQGRAVPGAVVTDGQVSVLTDERGGYGLAIYERAMTVTKPGRATVRYEAAEGREEAIVLEPRAARDVLAIDGRWSAGALVGLRAALGQAASSVVAYPGTTLGRLDVLVMVAPGALAPTERAAIAAWVRGGGRLVLCGEWGGYPDQDLTTLNELAIAAGITFTGGTVKTVADEAFGLTVATVTPPSLAAAVGGLPVQLYAATDVLVSGAAKPMLAGGPRAYAVLSTSRIPVVGAVGPAGAGKIFALGDSSLWRDDDSEGGQVPNVSRGANARLAQALLGW